MPARERAHFVYPESMNVEDPDSTIPRQGLIGLQVHGGGKVEAWYKDITIQELR